MNYEREKLAEFLFDGNKEKAKILLALLNEEEFTIPSEFKDLKMQLPEYSCNWCTSTGDCYLDMPDSLRECKGKCLSFWCKHTEDDKNEKSKTL